MDTNELPAESALDTARLLVDVIADAGHRVANIPGEPGTIPRFAVDIPPADNVDIEGVVMAALVVAARIPDVIAPDLPTSALLVLSSGTHAKATAFALRDYLSRGTYHAAV